MARSALWFRMASLTKPPSAMFNPTVGNDSHYLWTECPACDAIGIEFEWRAGRLCDCFEGNDTVRNNLSPRLVRG